MSRTQSTETSTTDVTQINLDRLLKRLEQTLLSGGADQPLRTSTYERNRVGANVEYARTLLLRLEQESSNIKVQSRKQTLQADLQAKRDLIKRLNQRLIELNQIDDTSDEEEEEEAGGTQTQEQAQREYAPPQQASNSIDTDPPPTTAVNPDPESTLRSRRPVNALQPDTATTSALFSGRSGGDQGPSSLAQTETLLSHNRYEQENITNSLVSLAQSLKQSSLQFAQSLEEEKSIVQRAESGLDQNALRMESAGDKMGVLRRMTEGQGFFGRLKLYAIIGVLWVVALLLVFVAPKLRFSPAL